MAKKQLEFFNERLRLDFGGSSLKGNAKKARPLDRKKPIHLVMRSSIAKGEKSFLRNGKRVRGIVRRQAKRFGVRIYEFAVVGNHFHLLVRITTPQTFKGFLRAVSGLIARAILGAERGAKKGIKFWDARPFTRIVEWGRGYAHAKAYVIQNRLEALGFIPFQPRASSA